MVFNYEGKGHNQLNSAALEQVRSYLQFLFNLLNVRTYFVYQETMLIILYSPTGGQKKLGKWNLLSYKIKSYKDHLKKRKTDTLRSRETIYIISVSLVLAYLDILPIWTTPCI